MWNKTKRTNGLAWPGWLAGWEQFVYPTISQTNQKTTNQTDKQDWARLKHIVCGLSISTFKSLNPCFVDIRASLSNLTEDDGRSNHGRVSEYGFGFFWKADRRHFGHPDRQRDLCHSGKTTRRIHYRSLSSIESFICILISDTTTGASHIQLTLWWTICSTDRPRQGTSSLDSSTKIQLDSTQLDSYLLLLHHKSHSSTFSTYHSFGIGF